MIQQVLYIYLYKGHGKSRVVNAYIEDIMARPYVPPELAALRECLKELGV